MRNSLAHVYEKALAQLFIFPREYLVKYDTVMLACHLSLL